MDNEFLIRIRADDAATATIKKIEAAFSRVTGPIEKAQGRVSKLGAIGRAGMENLSRGLSRVSNAARTAADSLSSMVPGMAALTGAASIAGIVALTARFSNMGFNLNKSSGLIGESRQSLQAWHIAASRAGVSAEEMDAGMVGMQAAIRGAAQGSNPEAMTLLTKMGVQIAKNKDGTVDYAKTQERVLEALRRQKSVQGQRAAAVGLGAGSLLPMIQRGTWEADRKDALESGLIQSDAAMDRAQQMQERINRFKERIDQIALTIGDKLVPVLQPVVEAFNQWFTENQEEIARGLSEAIGDFVTWIKSLNWSEINKSMKAFWDAIGGIKGVAVGLAVITFAGPVAGLISIVASLTRIGTLLAGPAIGAFFGIPGAAVVAAGAAVAYGSHKIQEAIDPTDKIGIVVRKYVPGAKWVENQASRIGLGIPYAEQERREGAYDLAKLVGRGEGDYGSVNRGIHGGYLPGREDLENMTVTEVMEAQDKGRFNAAGRYQTTRDTLRESVSALGIKGTEKFDRATQDKIFSQYLTGNKRPAIRDFLNGKSDDLNAALIDASKEWASIADPRTGRSYYAGDGHNRASISPQEAAQALLTSRAANGTPPPRTDSATPPSINITVNNAQPGTRVDVKGPEGFSLPTKVNYSLGDMGAMP